MGARIPAMKRMALAGVAWVLAALLAGCAWMPFVGDDEEAEAELETTEQILYESAQSSLRSNNYRAGIDKLGRLEARFPFGRYAEQAQLELIYANYMARDLEAAEAAADRFIRLHPQHDDIDYAYYLRGLIADAEGTGLFDRLRPADAAKRDTTNARKAFAHFAALLRDHPDSDYAKDARQRMIHLRNVIADSEIQIANYYISRGAHIAAANRARSVLENYSQTPAAAQALAILVEANHRLGLDAAANDALRILAINHPDFPAFDEQGSLVLEETVRNRDRSWVNVMSLGLFDRPDAPPPLRIEHPEGYVPPPTTAQAEAAPAERKKPWYKRILFMD